MNITQENTGDLTAIIKVEVIPADYQTQVTKSLNDYRKKANIPGFRQGKVPFGMVKKMYGQAVLAEEVQKIVNDSLMDFIREQDLKILGSPLPNSEKNADVDFKNDQAAFDFFFDIGLSPEVKIEVNEKLKATAHKIKVDDKVVDNYITDIRQRFGKVENGEQVMEEDWLKGTFKELDENGQVKEAGISSETSISLRFVKNEAERKKLIGKKIGDTVVINPAKAVDETVELSTMLGIKKEEAEGLTSDFEFTIAEIKRMVPADLNEELYGKVYGKDNIKTEEELRAKIQEEAAAQFSIETDRKLMNDVVKKLVADSKLELPEKFLKRYILATSENNELTEEKVNAEFDQYKESLKWQLIENKIITDGNLQVTNEDVREYYRTYFEGQFKQFAKAEEMDDFSTRINGIVDKAMENREETKKVYEKLYDDKVFSYIKSSIKIAEKEVSYEDFVKLASK